MVQRRGEIMRVIRLNNAKEGDTKRCYLHANFNGNSCVNGILQPIRLATPGAETGYNPECLSLVVAPIQKIAPGDFIAFNDGECVLQNEGEAHSVLKVIAPGFVELSARCSIWKPITAGILTVSDKGSRGERKDTAGPALCELLTAHGGIIKETQIVADDQEEITQILQHWSDNLKLDLVLTTGGTGLSKRDVTPEALKRVADREIPGMGEMMRLRGLSSTPRAFLTRGLGVTRAESLIIAFPGSERGARESFEAILPGLRHAIGILKGWETECGGHSHH